MANQLTKDLEIFFEDYVTSFEDTCIASTEAKKYNTDPQTMQRANETFWRPQDYHFNVVEGMDLTGVTENDLVQRMVPSVLNQPSNVIYNLTGNERRDPSLLQDAGRRAGARLASHVDTTFTAKVAAQAATVVTQTGANSWDLYGELDAYLDAIGAPLGHERKMFMNAKDYNAIAGELGRNQYTNGTPKTAYERAQIPDVASFRSFKNGSSPSITGSTVTGLTLGAEASYTPTAMTGDIPTDNRGMQITVSAGTLVNGDMFTIEGVEAVHMESKQPSGFPMTFRVISGGGTTTPTIYPAIVGPGNPYQNATAVGANGAAITLLNTTTNGANIGWVDGACELLLGHIAFPDDEGAKIMRATTKNGVEVVMGYQFNLTSGVTYIRNLVQVGAVVLEPQMCCIALPNQA